MFFILVMIERSETISSLVNQAMQQIVKEYFVKNAVYLDILVDFKNVKGLDETMRLLSEMMSHNLHDYDSHVFYPHKNMIVMLDSIENLSILEDYAERVKMTSFNNVLIYCKGMTTADLSILGRVTEMDNGDVHLNFYQFLWMHTYSSNTIGIHRSA